MRLIMPSCPTSRSRRSRAIASEIESLSRYASCIAASSGLLISCAIIEASRPLAASFSLRISAFSDCFLAVISSTVTTAIVTLPLPSRTGLALTLVMTSFPVSLRRIITSRCTTTLPRNAIETGCSSPGILLPFNSHVPSSKIACVAALGEESGAKPYMRKNAGLASGQVPSG